MNKYVAEFMGTFALVFIGCGTAMVAGCNTTGGYIATASAFGLTILAMVYLIGKKSGCHINPAVSLAVMLTKGMTKGEFIGYVIAQCFGSLVACSCLTIIFFFLRNFIVDMTGAFGANGLAGVGGNSSFAFWLEFILTFIFVSVILAVTSKKFKYGSFAGVIIGVTLFLIHIVGIRYTGTSVNPARSLGPAIFDGGDVLKCLWIFILAPLAGGAAAAGVCLLIRKKALKEDNEGSTKVTE